jgi:hypothetical protein
MAVRGGLWEWAKELREACRFRRASSRVIKSIISPPYPELSLEIAIVWA